MDKRGFLKAASISSAILGSGLASIQAYAGKKIKWKMVTTWPKNFPALGTGANTLAKLIQQMSAGRIQIKVYGAGELVPAFEVFDTVANGIADIGHGPSLYWKGKIPSAPFFTGIPYGLTGQEMNAWLYQGGGIELWRELYKPFAVIPSPAGNSGVQMAGWFNKKINSLDDLKGLKMRIPGIGGEVFQRAGGTPVTIPGGEIFTALKSGAIDATEWISPYNDLAFGFHKAAKYYYYPGWQEPGSTLECIINEQALKALPKDLQSIVLHACEVANQDMLAEFVANNSIALQTLKQKHGVQVKRIPDPVLKALKTISAQVVEEMIDKNPKARKIYESIQQFQTHVMPWHEISETAFYNARASS